MNTLEQTTDLYAEILPGVFPFHFIRPQQDVALAENFAFLFYPAPRSVIPRGK